MSRPLVIAAFAVLQIVALVCATGHYSVIGPGTIRSNFKYNTVVSVHKAEGPCKIEVGITGPSFNETKTVELQPMSTENVEFNVPKLKDGQYKLVAKGVSGITFENSTNLNYADYKPTIFIQTDKATYKPGDLVQFRVLFLDENTRPAKIEKPITIVINDGAQNRIKQIENVKLTKGVYTGEFQLSEQPVLGSWNIDVNVAGQSTETKSFEVAKYVLPKFEVTIETAKDVAIPDGVIKVTVRSKYTYGKSVKGKASVSIKPIYHYYGMNTGPEANKTIDVDGKGHVEFDLAKDLGITSERTYVPPLKVLAIMEEELTGNTYNATATVNLHSERYRIEGVNVPNNYHPGKPTQITVVVKNVDGSPVRDTKNKAKLFVHPPHDYIYRNYFMPGEIQDTPQKPEEKVMEFESNLDEHGMATFEFTLPEADRYYTVKCSFLDTTTYLSSISKFIPAIDTPELLKLSVIPEKPRLGKPVTVEVKSSEIIPYFVYAIVARGNIVKAEYVDVPEARKSQSIKFIPTFEMVPQAKLYVHYVFDNNLRFEEKTIDFEKDFENTIDISAQPQAKPGEEVQLQIRTDPDSFVGLLGVDQSVLLLKSGNDISKDQIFNSLNNYEASTPWMRGYGRYPGQQAGVVTMTNANYPYNDVIFHSHIVSGWGQVVAFSGIPGPPPPAVAFGAVMRPAAVAPPQPLIPHSSAIPTLRKNFIENWIFMNQENTEGNNFTLTKKIPDTITSWVVTGFSLNPKTGIAITADPTKIQVFQPFFVSTNLPYSVKRGEVIAIPVIIFNYMDKALDAEVVMDNTDKEYDFTEATNDIEENPVDEIKRVKRVSIPSNTGRSISFMIRPKKVGQVTLKITATTPLAGDAIHQMLKVEPEGVTQYENRAVFINLKDKPEYSDKLSVDIPAEAVPDSEYIEFSVVGDLLGPTVKNLDKLVRMPYGCGEQNMVNFVPNILVLRYLEAISLDMPSVVEKAKKFLEIGYQRELTYKHDDGSYSAFGKSDKSGSTWLTAYVMRSFHQAAKYTDIDPKVIVEGLDFLASKQAPNGSFPEYGRLFDSAHQNELGLTAYTLLAFLENVEHAGKYQAQIDNGLKYLLDNIDQTDDQYSLSIAALALQLAKNPQGAADKLLAKLQALAKQENNRKWWSKSNVTTETDDIWRWRPRSNDVEITSYILLAILDKEGAENALPIVKWLIAQRNSNGGFSSTQDTVVGLQALITFAEKTGSGRGEMDIEFVSGAGEESKGSIKVNPSNSLVLQTHVLPKTTRQVDFTAKGTGSSMVQLSYRYNLADKDKKPSFQVKTNVKNDKPTLVLEVCAEFVPVEVDDTKKESNMAVMEVALPSGYTADTDGFGDIEAVDRVKRTETKNSDSTVIVYFDGLAPGDAKCIPVKASKTHAVAKQKPAPVTVYDYYDTNQRATEYYQVQTSLCDICEGDDCGASCQKLKESQSQA